MKAMKAKCKIWKRKQTQTLFMQFQLLFIFYKLACLQKYFHGRALAIHQGIYSSDRHYVLIVIPIRIKENLVVNCKIISCACEVNWSVKSPIHLLSFLIGEQNDCKSCIMQSAISYRQEGENRLYESCPQRW